MAQRGEAINVVQRQSQSDADHGSEECGPEGPALPRSNPCQARAMTATPRAMMKAATATWR
jgi:hypothetical protein